MDLLIEKGDKRTYLSRYKVITTSFEESSPSVKRNNTQIQYRNGNVDFGGWNEAKTIDYVGYYRADDLEDEEYLRERIYALLSDPEGYYITQLKNDNDNSFERPGETSGDYFDKQVNRPSHKRFYVYASSLESELVGSYGGHVLYKISAKFTTMKLPYGESVPRDLDIKPNVPYYGRNYFLDSKTRIITPRGTANWDWRIYISDDFWENSDRLKSNNIKISFTLSAQKALTTDFNSNLYFSASPWYHKDISYPAGTTAPQKYELVFNITDPAFKAHNCFIRFQTKDTSDFPFVLENAKLEIGTTFTPWNPAPEDQEYNDWYAKTYYNTKNLAIPYAGTVPCNQLEQGFAIEFTAKEAGSKLVIDVNGTELTYSGQVYSGDVVKLSGYEYTKNDISIVKYTNKAYFKLIPGIANTISSNLHGSIKILGFQDLYA